MQTDIKMAVPHAVIEQEVSVRTSWGFDFDAKPKDVL